MSKHLSAAASTQFDSEVLHEYQGMGSLRTTVTVRTGVVGDTYKFRAMGKGIATSRGMPQTDVTPMDVSHSLQTATLENWVAPEYTDIFDAAEVNFQERTELAQTIAGALSRREDQLIIDAFDASSTYAGTVTTAIGGADTDLNPAKLRRASRYLNAKGVPMAGRNIAIGALQLEALLGNTEATSSDFNTVKALVNGDINAFVGFSFKLIEDRDAEEGGLTVAAGIRDCYAYHTTSTGYASGIDPRTEVNYVPVKTSWLANGLLKAGAVVRNSNGLVKVQCDEN
jgi:hypothetical protein